MKEPESLKAIKGMFNTKLLIAFEWFLGIQIFLGFLLKIKALFIGSLNDQSVAAGYFVCMLTTFVLFLFRGRLFAWGKQDKPGAGRRFVLIGSLGAVWVEIVFLAIDKFTGASGLAANPNLIINLLATILLYVFILDMMNYVQKRCGFNWITIFFLGGIYVTCADAVLSQILSGTSITTPDLMRLFVQYSTFVVIYSPMFLPAVWSVPYSNIQNIKENYKRSLMVLLPFLPLLIYSIVTFFAFKK